MEEEKKVIRGYKGFDKSLQCLGFQYEVGKEYECDKAVICKEGFHFCENPIDVLGYYDPSKSRYCEVEGSGEFDRSYSGDKICCSKIKIVREITLNELIEEYVKHCGQNRDREQAVISDADESIANNHSKYSATINNGIRSIANNRGVSSMATSTGRRSIANVFGAFSLAESIGDRSIAIASGYSSVAHSSGDSSMAVSFSDCSVAGTSSDSSVSVNMGACSCAYSNSYFSLAVSTGYNSVAIADGKGSIALATGERGKAKGALGNWIILTEYGEPYEGTLLVKDIKAFFIDGVNVKPDTEYRLINGNPVEVE